jgi:REP element-mobilizing transposase RayT
MSWIRIWIHLVFSTKNREPLLIPSEKRFEIIEHIKQNAKEKGIFIDSINSQKDHVHCLISLGNEKSISEIVKLIKGESSFWINKNKITKTKFSWQDDYWAVSVSESHIESVRYYIKNQEEHHRNKSFSEEVDIFMKKYGWKYIN